MDLFLFKAFDPSTRFYFFAIVLSVVISITLHELAHGWAAIRLGDNTPIRQNRMTGNPMVHMGPYSIMVLLLIGIAWGQMPIDPSRLRGKFAEAWVAIAGPATNFILALLGLTMLGVIQRFDLLAGMGIEENALNFLFYFGSINAILGVFNLFPIPPLDGSHVMANLNRGYAQFISDPSKQGVLLLGFLMLFPIARVIFPPVLNAAANYVWWIQTL